MGCNGMCLAIYLGLGSLQKDGGKSEGGIIQIQENKYVLPRELLGSHCFYIREEIPCTKGLGAGTPYS